MKSNRRLVFTEEADHDLRSLLAYSEEAWGLTRRDVYADRLSKAMYDLLAHPHLGRAKDDVYPGLRGRIVDRHVIYYLADERALTVVRILHVKMEPTRRLLDHL